MRRWLVLAVALGACNGDDDSARVDRLLDPKTCEECHPRHYEQWSSSMHAYAAEDPIFLAMNRRGQRETQGELGDFCVQCHAPMAVRLGKTVDGLNLDEVEDKYKGITCYFCHNVTGVEQTHNNELVIANDATMRGGIEDPAVSEAHDTQYSTLHDGLELESSRLCGGCHDLVLPNGVHLERTFSEWQNTFYDDPAQALPQSCNNCHMSHEPEPTTIADVEGVPGDRFFHEHYMPGPDVAITDFPGKQAQLDKMAELRNPAMCAELCVPLDQDGETIDARLWVHNEAAGHRFPSGATQDRRLWIELIAYDGDTIVYQTGVVAADEPVAHLDDPDLWLIRDPAFKENGEEAHMFWDVARTECLDNPDNKYCGLNIANEFGCAPDLPMWQMQDYVIPSPSITRITVRVLMRPIGLEVLDDLVLTGDLDASIPGVFPTHVVDMAGPVDEEVLEFTAESATIKNDDLCVAKVDTCTVPAPPSEGGFCPPLEP